MEGNRCVPLPDCPCYEGDRRYQPGAVRVRDCQTCMCVNGTFACEGEKCANETTCAPGSFQV